MQKDVKNDARQNRRIKGKRSRVRKKEINRKLKNMKLDFNFEKLKEQSLPRSPVIQNLKNKTILFDLHVQKARQLCLNKKLLLSSQKKALKQVLFGCKN